MISDDCARSTQSHKGGSCQTGFSARASGERGCDSSLSQLQRYCAIYRYVQRPGSKFIRLKAPLSPRCTPRQHCLMIEVESEELFFHAAEQDRVLRGEKLNASTCFPLCPLKADITYAFGMSVLYRQAP